MQVWDNVLTWIAGKVNNQAFEAWLRPLTPENLDNNTLTLRVPNKFFKEWVSNSYGGLIQEAFYAETGQRVNLEFSVAEGPRMELGEPLAGDLGLQPQPQPQPRVGSAGEMRLNQKYTFANFVAGASNQLAHAAALAVTEKIGTKFNPLFIYGGVGLGKTHLMHAIGNAIRQKLPAARICYISSEQFMNEFVWSVRNEKIDVFRRRFRREMDVLLMDDIQFIAGRQGTQDEFFHTFNALHGLNKQIVLTADKYPQEIPDLEERLRSRFTWGLIADIQPPEFETRLAIVKKKADDEGIVIPDEVAAFLASSIKSNVRELEGSLINLAANASLEKRQVIDLIFARETLKKVISLQQSSLTVENVQETVCKHFNVTVEEMRGDRRHRAISLPRQIAMYLCRKGLNTSFPDLGVRFGGKDHTTAIAACKRIGKLVAEDVEMRSRIEALQRLLGF